MNPVYECAECGFQFEEGSCGGCPECGSARVVVLDFEELIDSALKEMGV